MQQRLLWHRLLHFKFALKHLHLLVWQLPVQLHLKYPCPPPILSCLAAVRKLTSVSNDTSDTDINFSKVARGVSVSVTPFYSGPGKLWCESYLTLCRSDQSCWLLLIVTLYYALYKLFLCFTKSIFRKIEISISHTGIVNIVNIER